MKYEVRSIFAEDETGNTSVVETVRTDRKAAEQDVELLKSLGKKAWIVEV